MLNNSFCCKTAEKCFQNGLNFFSFQMSAPQRLHSPHPHLEWSSPTPRVESGRTATTGQETKVSLLFCPKLRPGRCWQLHLLGYEEHTYVQNKAASSLTSTFGCNFLSDRLKSCPAWYMWIFRAFTCHWWGYAKKTRLCVRHINFVDTCMANELNSFMTQVNTSQQRV